MMRQIVTSSLTRSHICLVGVLYFLICVVGVGFTQEPVRVQYTGPHDSLVDDSDRSERTKRAGRLRVQGFNFTPLYQDLSESPSTVSTLLRRLEVALDQDEMAQGSGPARVLNSIFEPSPQLITQSAELSALTQSVERCLTEMYLRSESTRPRPSSLHIDRADKKRTSPRRVVLPRRTTKLNILAWVFIKGALTSYREVDLERAQAGLSAALELFATTRYRDFAPADLAALNLWRGVISVEQQSYVHATLYFKTALLLDPSVRLKLGVDRDDVVKVFSEVLAGLRALPPLELARLMTLQNLDDSERESVVSPRSSHALLTLVRVKETLFASLLSPPARSNLKVAPRENPSVDVEVDLEESSGADLSKERLANAAHSAVASLEKRTARAFLIAYRRYLWGHPQLAKRIVSAVEDRLRRFNQTYHVSASRARESWRVSILGGWVINSYLKSPVSGLVHSGPALKLGWRISDHFELQLNGSWSLQARDINRDLTQGVSSGRVSLAPYWVIPWSRVRLSLGAGLEGEYISGSAITREVGCKFFDLSSSIPPEICDTSRDIQILDETWRLSARLEIDMRLLITRYFQAGVQIFSSFRLYDSNPHPLGIPFGIGLLLGYSSNSHSHSPSLFHSLAR